MEIRRLRHAIKRNKTVRSIFEHFASCENNSIETTVEYLLAVLQQPGGTLRRMEVVALLKYLESLGCGKFTPGRHSKPSRMSWNSELRTLGNIALEQDDEFLSPISGSAPFVAGTEATADREAA
jgi:hypothetical protein